MFEPFEHPRQSKKGTSKCSIMWGRIIIWEDIFRQNQDLEICKSAILENKIEILNKIYLHITSSSVLLNKTDVAFLKKFYWIIATQLYGMLNRKYLIVTHHVFHHSLFKEVKYNRPTCTCVPIIYFVSVLVFKFFLTINTSDRKDKLTL